MQTIPFVFSFIDFFFLQKMQLKFVAHITGNPAGDVKTNSNTFGQVSIESNIGFITFIKQISRHFQNLKCQSGSISTLSCDSGILVHSSLPACCRSYIIMGQLYMRASVYF